jgi:hypothetical protein
VSRMPTGRRRWLVAVGVLAALVVVWWVAMANDHAVPIDSYRVVNDRTLVVVAAGSNAREWCRVTGVTETTSAVSIAAQCVEFLPLPGAGVGKEVELTVQLVQPLGARAVVDSHMSPIRRLGYLRLTPSAALTGWRPGLQGSQEQFCYDAGPAAGSPDPLAISLEGPGATEPAQTTGRWCRLSCAYSPGRGSELRPPGPFPGPGRACADRLLAGNLRA